MELNLQDREWKEFAFKDIFKIEKGFYNKKPISSGKGTIPFLSATQYNNGISEFYTETEIDNTSKTGDENNHSIDKKIFKGNCIAVTNNGSIGYAFYQVSEFSCSHDVNPLYLKKYELNRFVAMFLISAIEKQRVCFKYARKWRPIRMVKSKILLPTNSQGEPDYEFMENYIKVKEKELLERYVKYNSLKISKLEWGG